jgi:uncharacterized protein (DUF3084 family)
LTEEHRLQLDFGERKQNIRGDNENFSAEVKPSVCSSSAAFGKAFEIKFMVQKIREKILTVHFTRRQTRPSVVHVRSTVENAQQHLGELQQESKTVESKVNQVSGQFDHLEGQFVLVRIGEWPLLHGDTEQI